MASSQELALGDKMTVQTMQGREDSVISRLQDGIIVLFDQNSKYFDKLSPGQSVEGHIIHIQENFIILAPISEPKEIGEPEEFEYVYIPEIQEVEVYVDDIVEELEKMIEKVKGNARVIPRAILKSIRLHQKSIRLQQLIIKILTGRA